MMLRDSPFRRSPPLSLAPPRREPNAVFPLRAQPAFCRPRLPSPRLASSSFRRRELNSCVVPPFSAARPPPAVPPLRSPPRRPSSLRRPRPCLRPRQRARPPLVERLRRGSCADASSSSSSCLLITNCAASAASSSSSSARSSSAPSRPTRRAATQPALHPRPASPTTNMYSFQVCAARSRPLPRPCPRTTAQLRMRLCGPP
mmetsp:Transcript_21136/g.51927  ORF Transcript_21136/g.51927 Transcript_21136/m.51927 type:complete len:202 (+) Transcript_21136:130-735(+)